MVSTSNLMVLALKIFAFIILNSNQVPTSVYTGLLSRLYKKAADSNRPLIVILDSDFLASNQNRHKRPSKALDSISKQLASQRHREADLTLDRLLEDKHLHKLVTPSYKELQISNLEDHYHGLLPVQKKRAHKDQIGLRSPIIKNLLRISNNLRCQARSECDNECTAKYSGPKQDKCSNACEAKFECEPEEKSDECDDECAESQENDCGGNECQGSTKGYASTDPKPPCPEC